MAIDLAGNKLQVGALFGSAYFAKVEAEVKSIDGALMFVEVVEKLIAGKGFEVAKPTLG